MEGGLAVTRFELCPSNHTPIAQRGSIPTRTPTTGIPCCHRHRHQQTAAAHTSSSVAQQQRTRWHTLQTRGVALESVVCVWVWGVTCHLCHMSHLCVTCHQKFWVGVCVWGEKRSKEERRSVHWRCGDALWHVCVSRETHRKLRQYCGCNITLVIRPLVDNV